MDAKKLTLKGSGSLYKDKEEAPWQQYKDVITTLEINGDVAVSGLDIHGLTALRTITVGKSA